MANEMTREQILASIVPNSDQLTADDFLAGPRTFTVAGISPGNKEQPVNIRLQGEERVYRPCKTFRRVLVHLWSDDGHVWIGRRMTLFRNPEVKYGRVKIGGIQISHLSGIPGPAEVTVTESKLAGGQIKKMVVKILPLAEPHAEDRSHEVLTFGDQSWSRTARGAQDWANAIGKAAAGAASSDDGRAIFAEYGTQLVAVRDKFPEGHPTRIAIDAVLDYQEQISV